MTYKDNQPTFNVGNRKVVNFKDYLQNKDAEKAKLTKAHLQSKPNSEDQQHPGNTRNEYNPVTHKLTDYSVDEIEDTLDDMQEETNERMKHIKRFNETNTYTYTLLNKNEEQIEIEADDIDDANRKYRELYKKGMDPMLTHMNGELIDWNKPTANFGTMKK